MLKAWNSRSSKTLPYDAEVEWIESTGTQYVDTGFTAVAGFEATVDFQLTRTDKTSYLIGSHNLSEPWGRNCFGTNISNMKWELGYNDPNLFGSVDNIRHIIHISTKNGNAFADLDGIRLFQLSTPRIDTPQENILLFGMQYFIFVTSNRITSFARIFSCNLMVDGKNFIFIPVRFTNENGVSEGAMYDRVSGQLFRNSGTGAFVIGPDK